MPAGAVRGPFLVFVELLGGVGAAVLVTASERKDDRAVVLIVLLTMLGVLTGARAVDELAMSQIAGQYEAVSQGVDQLAAIDALAQRLAQRHFGVPVLWAGLAALCGGLVLGRRPRMPWRPTMMAASALLVVLSVGLRAVTDIRIEQDVRSLVPMALASATHELVEAEVADHDTGPVARSSQGELVPGDVVMAVNGQAPATVRELVELLVPRRGERVRLTVRRDRALEEVVVQVGAER